jgi:flagellar motility protein MotE (MotC chaperone)
MPPWLKLVFALKLAAVLAYVAIDLQWVRFGERVSNAAPDSANPPVLATDDDGYHEAERPKPTRKGYLDDLFDIPEIDTTQASKEEMAKYVAIVEKKRLEVDERIALLSSREERLIDIEKSIDTKLAKLDEERKYFQDTIQKEKEMTEERTKELVEFYKKMPPKSAAPVFEKLDKDLVVTLFKNLPQKQITSILGLMNPDTSVKLTEYYGRIRSGREYELLKEINKSLSVEFDQCKGMPEEQKKAQPSALK